jgi:hypothetical protein
MASNHSSRPDQLQIDKEPVNQLTGLLKILEGKTDKLTLIDLYFSMPIPEELVHKYNILKENVYQTIPYQEYAPITRYSHPNVGKPPEKSSRNDGVNTSSWSSLVKNITVMVEILCDRVLK